MPLYLLLPDNLKGNHWATHKDSTCSESSCSYYQPRINCLEWFQSLRIHARCHHWLCKALWQCVEHWKRLHGTSLRLCVHGDYNDLWGRWAVRFECAENSQWLPLIITVLSDVRRRRVGVFLCFRIHSCKWWIEFVSLFYVFIVLELLQTRCKRLLKKR